MQYPFSPFRHWLGPVDACPAYSWRNHGLLLSPILIILVFTGWYWGWWGEAVWRAFIQLREQFPELTVFLKYVSKHAANVVYAAYVAVLVSGLWKNDKNTLRFIVRFVVVQLTVTLVLTQAMKIGLGIPRPGREWPPQPWVLKTSYHSFPSGHTAEIVAIALPLAVWCARRWVSVSLALLVALVGFSRIWLGAHHPVDILGGVVVGSLAARYAVFCVENRQSKPLPVPCPGIRAAELTREPMVELDPVPGVQPGPRTHQPGAGTMPQR